MTTLHMFTKDNYGKQVPLIYSMFQNERLLGALEHEFQNKVTGKEDTRNVTAEKQLLHTKVVKDPDTENITDANEYKLKNIKFEKWTEKQRKESSLKDVIFAVLPNEYQDLMKKDLKIAQHQFASLTNMLKFIDKSFGTTTIIVRRKEQREVLPSLPLPKINETGDDMLRNINATLNRFKEKHLEKMNKAEQEIYLTEIILNAVDNTPQLKSKFYAHDQYGEQYGEICTTLTSVYQNIEMTDTSDMPPMASASAASNDTRGRSKDRLRSKSPTRTQSNLKSGRGYSPQRSNSPKKYCEYHATDCNHSTENCYAFKKLVNKFSNVVKQWTSDKKSSFSAESDYDE